MAMQGLVWMVSLWVDGIGLGQAPPWMLGWNQVERMNRRLHGSLVSYTRHGLQDRRIYSPALGRKRDMLVYLPPGYDPNKQYPLALFLHGAAQDEQFFMQALVQPFDREIAAGRLQPVIVAAPDGSIHGRATLHDLASFWADTRAGNFETYLMRDVWNFMHQHYSIRPEREAHAVMGVSMGGSAAVRIGIEYRNSVGMAVGIMPLVNLRHVDARGKYRTPFNLIWRHLSIGSKYFFYRIIDRAFYRASTHSRTSASANSNSSTLSGASTGTRRRRTEKVPAAIKLLHKHDVEITISFD